MCPRSILEYDVLTFLYFNAALDVIVFADESRFIVGLTAQPWLFTPWLVPLSLHMVRTVDRLANSSCSL